MLEPIWLSPGCAQPSVLSAAQARAVWRALCPAAGPDGPGEPADSTLVRARAQQLLELALRCSQATGDAGPAAPASAHDSAPELHSAIRTWHLHRRACGLPTGAAHIGAAALRHIRLALRSGWPAALSSATAALPCLSLDAAAGAPADGSLGSGNAAGGG